MAVSAFRSVSDLPATTLTDVHTMTYDGTANIYLVNRSSADVTVRCACRDGAIANEDYLQYDGVTLVADGGYFELSGIVAVASEILTFYSSATGVSVRVSGWYM